MKNKLLYYQGGGYDGCIWEWNFCFWDADGVWHNLYASGCGGLKTETEAIKLAETLELKAELIDLIDEKAFEQFQKDNNARLVLSIANELNVQHNYNLKLTCCECGCEFIADRSEGNTAINDYDIICYECLVTGTCDVCNEYVGGDKINHYNNDDVDDVSIKLTE